jgi:hypothetical protein
VTTTAELEQWVRAWSSDPEAAAILRPSLVDEPGVHVLAATSRDASGHAFGDAHRDAHRDAPRDASDGLIVAGAILHVTGAVAGLGNIFDREGDEHRTWREAAAAAREVARGTPIVGWEAGATVGAAVAAGCERLGPLTVWLK